jgi:hypothetical protein
MCPHAPVPNTTRVRKFVKRFDSSLYRKRTPRRHVLREKLDEVDVTVEKS